MNLQQLVDFVSRLKPGERVAIDPREFEVGRGSLDGFTAPDWVLENIVGSSYEFRYYEEFPTRHVVFERLAKPLDGNLLSYVSPDRKDWFDVVPGGLYQRKSAK